MEEPSLEQILKKKTAPAGKLTAAPPINYEHDEKMSAAASIVYYTNEAAKRQDLTSDSQTTISIDQKQIIFNAAAYDPLSPTDSYSHKIIKTREELKSYIARHTVKADITLKRTRTQAMDGYQIIQRERYKASGRIQNLTLDLKLVQKEPTYAIVQTYNTRKPSPDFDKVTEIIAEAYKDSMARNISMGIGVVTTPAIGCLASSNAYILGALAVLGTAAAPSIFGTCVWAINGTRDLVRYIKNMHDYRSERKTKLDGIRQAMDQIEAHTENRYGLEAEQMIRLQL